MEDLSYPLRWPAGWPRATSRKTAAFNKKDWSKGYQRTVDITIADAMDRLQTELDRLKARSVVLSSNLERNLNGSPRSGQSEPKDPGVAVYFRLDGKPTVLACDKWDRAADNIVALAKHIEAIRGIDRWGVGTIAQAFAGYQALEAPEQWWQVLGVAQSAGKNDVDAAYRARALRAHPDHGGTDAQMARLNAARDRAYQELGISGEAR